MLTPKKVGKKYVDVDTYVRTLDKERIRLITKLKVSVFLYPKSGDDSSHLHECGTPVVSGRNLELRRVYTMRGASPL